MPVGCEITVRTMHQQPTIQSRQDLRDQPLQAQFSTQQPPMRQQPPTESWAQPAQPSGGQYPQQSSGGQAWPAAGQGPIEQPIRRAQAPAQQRQLASQSPQLPPHGGQQFAYGSHQFGPQQVPVQDITAQPQPVAGHGVSRQASAAPVEAGAAQGYGSTQPSLQPGAQSIGAVGTQSMGSQQGSPARSEGWEASPQVDVIDTPDSVTVFVDLPGCEEDDITIQADDDALLLTAERLVEYDDESALFQRERPSRIRRAIQLPPGVDIERASATYENGVAKIVLPRSEDGQKREIGFQ